MTRQVSVIASTLMLFSQLAPPARETVPARALITHINSIREFCELPPLRPSDLLAEMAQDRAYELSLARALDFEPLPGNETLEALRVDGYPALWAQELDALVSEDPCEAVDRWSERLEDGEGFLRHEVQEIGVATGLIDSELLYVVILAVPPSNDPNRKRFPGVAPREWLTADLWKELNARRMASGLRTLERDEGLDRVAQRRASEILRGPQIDGAGSITGAGDVAVYYKAEGLSASVPAFPLRIWFEQFREPLTQRGGPRVGVGLDSRGRGERLEAVWVVAFSGAHAR